MLRAELSAGVPSGMKFEVSSLLVFSLLEREQLDEACAIHAEMVALRQARPNRCRRSSCAPGSVHDNTVGVLLRKQPR